jgi:hypothetical protein
LDNHRYYLDTSSWITLFQNDSCFDAFKNKHKSNAVQIAFSFSNVYELVIKDNISTENRRLNVIRINEIGLTFTPDAVFLSAYTPLGLGRLAKESDSDAFNIHVNTAIPENHYLDAIHAINANFDDATLITDDQRLINFAYRLELPCLQYFEFSHLIDP